MTGGRVLITGATGFVGSHIVRRFFQSHWEVHAIVRPESDRKLLSEFTSIEVHEHSGSTASMLTILERAKPELVIHLASTFLSDHQPGQVEDLVQSNLLFGTQLVEAMTKAGALSLVNTGTAWQNYESMNYSPVNLYAATKQAFEDLLQYYVEARALRVVTLKLPDTYGPDDPRPKLLNLLRRLQTSNEPLRMSPGDQLIDLVHITDVVSAFVRASELALQDGEPDHERYSVTSGESISLRMLVEQIQKIIDQNLPIVWGGRPYRGREVMRPTIGETLSGWSPQISLAEGLREVFVRGTN